MQLDISTIAANVISWRHDENEIEKINAILEYASSSGPYTSSETGPRKYLAKIYLLIQLLRLDSEDKPNRQLYDQIYGAIAGLALEPRPPFRGPVSMPIYKPYDDDAIVMLVRDILRTGHMLEDLLERGIDHASGNKKLLHEYTESLVNTFEAVFQPSSNMQLCDYLTQDIKAFVSQITDPAWVKRLFDVIQSLKVVDLPTSKIQLLALFAAKTTFPKGCDDYDCLLDKCFECLTMIISKVKSGDAEAGLCVDEVIRAVGIAVIYYSKVRKKRVKIALDLFSKIFSDKCLSEDIRLRAASEFDAFYYTADIDHKLLKKYIFAISKLPFAYRLSGHARLLYFYREYPD